MKIHVQKTHSHAHVIQRKHHVVYVFLYPILLSTMFLIVQHYTLGTLSAQTTSDSTQTTSSDSNGGYMWYPIPPEDTTQIVRIGIGLGFAPHRGLDFTNRLSSSQNQIVLLPLSIALHAGLRVAPRWEVDIRIPVNLDGYDRNTLLRFHRDIIPNTARTSDISLTSGMMIAASFMTGMRYSFAPYNRSGMAISAGAGVMIAQRSGYTLTYLTSRIHVPSQIELLPTFYLAPQYRLRMSNQWSLTAELYGLQWIRSTTFQLHSLSLYVMIGYHF